VLPDSICDRSRKATDYRWELSCLLSECTRAESIGSRDGQIWVRKKCKESMMNTIPEHIKAPLHRLIDGGLPVDEIAFMMQLSEEAVKQEIERVVAASIKTRARAAGSLPSTASSAGGPAT
jgi:hypothetical protein